MSCRSEKIEEALKGTRAGHPTSLCGFHLRYMEYLVSHQALVISTLWASAYPDKRLEMCCNLKARKETRAFVLRTGFPMEQIQSLCSLERELFKVGRRYRLDPEEISVYFGNHEVQAHFMKDSTP